MRNLIVIRERGVKMSSHKENDPQETLENLELPQVDMPKHKENLKMQLLAWHSLEANKNSGFISSLLINTVEVIRMKKKALVVVPAIFLLLFALSYQLFFSSSQAVASLTLEVNPALTLVLDEKSTVLEAEGENMEGETILEDSDLKGKNLKEALEEVISQMHGDGYLTSESDVVITVQPTNTKLEEEKLDALFEYAQQSMSEVLSLYDVHKLDSYFLSHSLHSYLKELGLTPLDYADLLKANLSEEEIKEVINALERTDAQTGKLPYLEFELEIESDYRELSVEFEQKRYGIYAEVEIEENGKEIELEGSAALDYLLPILKNLDINASMPRKTIVEKVLTAFGWEEDYDDFEIEVKFADGSYIDFDWEK